jgi:hypothetical protein
MKKAKPSLISRTLPVSFITQAPLASDEVERDFVLCVLGCFLGMGLGSAATVI